MNNFNVLRRVALGEIVLLEYQSSVRDDNRFGHYERSYEVERSALHLFSDYPLRRYGKSRRPHCGRFSFSLTNKFNRCPAMAVQRKGKGSHVQRERR